MSGANRDLYIRNEYGYLIPVDMELRQVFN
jgi:hypothetical protein